MLQGGGSEPGIRLAAWHDTIVDLLGEPLREMPHQLILETMAKTFDVTAVSHSTSDALGRQQVITHPRDVLKPVADLDEWLAGRTHKHHPLLRWHAATRNPRPTTIERVPMTMVSARDRYPLISGLKQHGFEQQIAISYRLSGAAHRAYVLGRAGADFTDDDLVVARYVQRAVIGLDRQVSMIRQLRHLHRDALDVGLTGREVSVLALLAAGHSNRVIAHRLGCAPRTVEKHLEQIFRKLDVRDRLNAVRIARSWGLVV